jgi:hypothetical protein
VAGEAAAEEQQQSMPTAGHCPACDWSRPRPVPHGSRSWLPSAADRTSKQQR